MQPIETHRSAEPTPGNMAEMVRRSLENRRDYDQA
jgi:hypothetical protein